MDVKDEKWVLQYNVRGWWHDFFAYHTEADALRAAERTQEIARYPRRIVSRMVTDTIKHTYDAKREG
jgi:hypothetical protein